MGISPDLAPAFDLLWLTARVILVGTLGLYLVTIGNPRELRATVRILHIVNAAPPTVLFRWREHEGYEVVVYNTATDEEEVKPPLFQPVRWSPTFLLWPKRGPQPKNVMLRSALLSVLARFLFFLCFHVGGFCLLTWLTVTQSWHWGVALGVLAVHQLAFSRTDTYFVWMRKWLFLVVGLGVWLYLRGGAFETIAVCAVGTLVTLAILGQWYMRKSWRWERMKALGYGPLDLDRKGRLW